MNPVRVLLVDDQPLLRTGFHMIIDAEPDLHVVGEAGDGAEAVRACAALRPDVVVMDIRMPVLDGVAATRSLLSPDTDPGTRPRVLVLTTFDLDEYVVAALRAGASGFLLKDAPAAQLLDAVRIVARGDAVVAPGVTRRLLERFAALPAAAQPPTRAALTGREHDVLRWVARGLSNAEIAERLVITETTVKTHVHHLLTKLDLRDRVQLVVHAYDTGLVTPGGSNSS